MSIAEALILLAVIVLPVAMWVAMVAGIDKKEQQKSKTRVADKQLIKKDNYIYYDQNREFANFAMSMMAMQLQDRQHERETWAKVTTKMATEITALIRSGIELRYAQNAEPYLIYPDGTPPLPAANYYQPAELQFFEEAQYKYLPPR